MRVLYQVIPNYPSVERFANVFVFDFSSDSAFLRTVTEPNAVDIIEVVQK